MLRALALVLLLANGGYFAWANGYLLPYGFGPAVQSEPQRLAQQVKPDTIRLLSVKEFQRIEEQVKAEQEHKECLQAGPFDAPQAEALRRALADALPSEAWKVDETQIAARWIIYMGKYANADVLAKKRAEVAGMNLRVESLKNATLEPGFSLGAFESKAEADAALARMVAKGLHTARVLQEQAAALAYQLTLPAVNAALKPKLEGIQAALAGKPLHACH